ncbi:MAG TPA: META domain-containing protein [Actinomycetota bacterium]|nr:META domain-containing protein [Actinomycetota bacterium]
MSRRQPKEILLVALVLPLAAMLPACGDDEPSGSEALEGVSWILTQFVAEDGSTQIVDVGVSAEFDGSTISGVSGCNRYNASYEASGDEISFGPIAGTQMACPEPQMSVETRYVQLLESVATFEVEGRAMSMTDGEGTPVLQFSQG